MPSCPFPCCAPAEGAPPAFRLPPQKSTTPTRICAGTSTSTNFLQVDRDMPNKSVFRGFRVAIYPELPAQICTRFAIARISPRFSIEFANVAVTRRHPHLDPHVARNLHEVTPKRLTVLLLLPSVSYTPRRSVCIRYFRSVVSGSHTTPPTRSHQHAGHPPPARLRCQSAPARSTYHTVSRTHLHLAPAAAPVLSL